jgi:hypothetical protein
MNGPKVLFVMLCPHLLMSKHYKRRWRAERIKNILTLIVPQELRV